MSTGEKNYRTNNAIRSAVRRALVVGALTTVAGYAPIAGAQEGAEQIEEIITTGTRISNRDFEGASPIVSISAELFDQSGVANAEELVNTLPQVVPSFSSGNNNPGNGQSWINLRGLGSARNLVLVDGKRPTPSNEDMIVDINTIPVAMIERVEIISGGASAVYGSEAIAGATNFILKKDFNGIDISAQWGQSSEGDTEKYALDFVMGSDLADGKGNATVWATLNDRDRLGKGERTFSSQAVSVTSFFPSGHVRLASGNEWTLASVQDVFVNMYGAEAPQVRTTLVGNDDGTLFTSGNTNGADSGIINFRTVLGEDIDGLFVSQNFRNGVLDDDRYSYNFEPWNNLQTPQTRYNMGAMMNFEVSSNVEAYSRLMFTNYESSTQLAPSPAPTSPNITNPAVSAEFTVPVTNPFVVANAGLSQILASRTGDNLALPGTGAAEDFIYRRRFVENGARIESYQRDVYQMLVGIRGDINDDWSFDIWGAAGKYNEQLNQDGNVSVTRVESLLDAADGGVSLCDGGLNPIGALTLSPECAAYVGVLAKNTTRIKQNQFEAVLNGTVTTLPAGDLGVAVGFFYHDVDYSFKADEILASGDVSGFNVVDNIDGGTHNSDYFVEAYIPLLADKPGVEHLGLTLGYRATDHNLAGNFGSYKAEVDWNVTDTFRVRSGFQRAVRAPNVGELFSPLGEDNPSVNDPCNFDSAERMGPDAVQVEALCVAQGIPVGTLPTYAQSTGQIDALQGGNPDVTEETADTITVGFVWQPEVAQGFQLSIDYFDIDVEDVITFIDPSIVVSRCFNNGGFNPTYSVTNEWCARFGRSLASSEIRDLLELQENIGGLAVVGVDVQLDYGFDIGNAGTIDLNLVTTFLDENSEQSLPGEVFVDYAGTIGQRPAEALPDLKSTLTAVWHKNDWSTTFRFRYIDSMEHKESVLSMSTDEAICGCTGVGSVIYVDASTRWQATDELSIRAGITNLLDEDVELYTPDQDSGTNPSVYDVVGLSYFMKVNYAF